MDDWYSPDDLPDLPEYPEYADEHTRAPFEIAPDDVSKYLGRPVFYDDLLYADMVPGITNGLAWTAMGGSVLTVEAIISFWLPDHQV